MLVHIVYVPDAAKLGPDLTRIGNLEEVPDELGRVMLGTGEARQPTDEERADWEATRELDEPAAAVRYVDVPLPDDAGAVEVPAAE